MFLLFEMNESHCFDQSFSKQWFLLCHYINASRIFLIVKLDEMNHLLYINKK